jgi:hypothetical protein
MFAEYLCVWVLDFLDGSAADSYGHTAQGLHMESVSHFDRPISLFFSMKKWISIFVE